MGWNVLCVQPCRQRGDPEQSDSAHARRIERRSPHLPSHARGLPVQKIEGKTASSYWAENGNYAVGAGEPAVMEELLNRLENKSSQAGSLVQSAAYQESVPVAGNGVLEFFLRVPDLKDFMPDSKPGPFPVQKFLDAARLDAVHSSPATLLWTVLAPMCRPPFSAIRLRNSV